MKTKIFTLITAYLIYAGNLSAQKENNVWTFGPRTGIDFNSGSAIIKASAITTIEGSASICDKEGNLMFYTNGINVWDKTHNIMPNGADLADRGMLSSTMAAAIAPVISDTNLFFLFTVDPYNYPRYARLRYSLVDMRLNGAKGDIVPGIKSIQLPDTPMSEKIIVAPACGGVWVITHHADSPIFFAYKINSLIIPEPIRSVTPGIIKQDYYTGGEMKLSPDESQIVLCNGVYDSASIEIVLFDKNTGILSNTYSIKHNDRRAYSADFSPDGSKLYVCPQFGRLRQYDISLLPDILAVQTSLYETKSSTAVGIRRGPDHKMYFISAPLKLSRINDPNKSGVACDLELEPSSLLYPVGPIEKIYYNLGNKTMKPIPIEESKVIASRKDVLICAGELYTANAGRDLYLWNDGDTSRSRILSHGVYWLTSYKDCDVYRDTIIITEKPLTLVTTSFDTVVCFEKSITLTAASVQDQYLWNDGNTGRSNTFTESGLKWVNARDNNNCILHTDTFKVSFTDFEINIPDTSICANEIIKLNAEISKPASYLWQDGSTDNNFMVNTPGRYEVTVSIGDCRKKEEITVVRRLFDPRLPADTTICAGDPIILKANIDNAAYLWQDNSTTQTITVQQPGTYKVQVTQGSCSAEASISVEFRQCNNCIHIPNAFSPNGDGKNDDFKVILSCQVKQYALQIVNRYGEVIFRSKTPGERWNGHFNGREQELGVYYYLLQVTFDRTGAVEELYKGDISLIR